jgi:hypothetical protein
METLRGEKQTGANLLERTKSLVSLILLRLDEIIRCIEQIHAAFQSEDIHLASRVLKQMQRATSHAYVAILTLEQHTGCRQVNARSALAYCRHLARMPQSLAWCLISQLPSTYRSGEQSIPEILRDNCCPARRRASSTSAAGPRSETARRPRAQPSNASAACEPNIMWEGTNDNEEHCTEQDQAHVASRDRASISLAGPT